MAVIPTPRDLIEALRKPGESYEALAARLPVSLSTVNRWKNRPPRDWANILQMLDAAGWLTADADSGPTRPAEERRLEDDPAFATEMEELAQLLERLLQRVSGPRRSQHGDA